MLKKSISFSLILLIVFLIYQYSVNFFKSNHTIEYSIEKDGTYLIEENYISSNDSDYYLIKVKDKSKKEFVFEIKNIFNKQKQIVDDISVYSDGDWYCLALIYKNKQKSSVPLCEKGGTVFSYSYIKDSVDLTEYVSKLPNFEYNSKKYENTSKTDTIGDTIIVTNKGYLDENETLVFYNYKFITILTNKIENRVSFSNEDKYKNTLGAAVGKYYIIPKYTSSPTIKEYIKYDFSSNVKNIVSYGTELSKQSSYINGVYNNKLYVFDRSTLTQYEIDPYNEKVNITGNKEKDAFVVINGEKKTMSVYDMNEQNVTFTSNTDLYKNLNYDQIIPYSEFAILIKNGLVSKVYNKYPNNPIVLLNEPDSKEIKATIDSIYYVKDDTLHKYNKYGNFEIIKTNELRYNYENVYDVFINN